MSVASDPLLNAAPVAKPQAAQAKTQPKQAEPSNDDASSFAKVYAKERQDKAVDRNEAAAKHKQAKSNDKADDKEPAADAPATASSDQPVVADSGNSLPTDEAPADPVIDPMILLAMAGQQVAQPSTEDTALPTTGEGEDALDASLSLTTLLPTTGTPVENDGHDPQVDAMSELPGVDLVLDLATKAQAAVQKSAVNPSAAQAGQTGGQDFAAAMAQLTANTEGGESKVTDELALFEKGKDGIEALKDSNVDLHGDASASKLNALNQALNQQVNQAQRTPLVPGAPVSMQQGAWTDEVVDKVMWMSSQNLKSADIQLDPPDLGRLEVRINMAQDQQATQVTFASPHVGVRDAVTESMQRLRDMFTQQGMTMDVNVSDQSLNRGWAGQNGGDGQQSRGGSSRSSLFGGDEEISVSTSEIRSSGSLSGGRGLVDYYA